jgi:hypothetical protein
MSTILLAAAAILGVLLLGVLIWLNLPSTKKARARKKRQRDHDDERIDI